MNTSRRLLILILNVTTISLMVAGISIYLLYQNTLQRTQSRLKNIIEDRGDWIETLSKTECPVNSTLSNCQEKVTKILSNNQYNFNEIEEEDEIVIAQRQDQDIIFVLVSNYRGQKKLKPILWNHNLDQSLRKAFQGQSGIMICQDYEGIQVIAAYQFIEPLQWAIVAKTNLAEIQSPFIETGIYTLIIAILLNGLGSILLLKLGQNLTKNTREFNQKLQQEVEERTQTLTYEFELLSRIMETSSLGILVLNLAGEIVRANPQAEKILGLSQEQLLQRRYNDPQWKVTDLEGNLIPEEDFPFYQVITNNHSVYNFCCGLETSPGKNIFLCFNATALSDNHQQLQGVLITLEDITQKIQIEQDKLISETQLRAIFDNSILGMAIVTLDGKTIKSNPALQRMLGFSDQELRQMHFTEFTHPDDIPLSLSHYQEIASGEKDFYQIEKRYITKSGDIIWGHLSVSMVRNEQGQAQFLTAMIEDITAYKQAQKIQTQLIRRNESLIEAFGEMVYEHNVIEDSIIWSGNYTQVLGYSPEEIGNDGQSWLGRVHPDDLPSVLAEFERAWQENHFYSLEYRFLHQNGSYYWVHDRGVMHGDPTQEQPEEVIGILEDITSRKQGEAELEGTKNQLEVILQSIADGISVLDSQGKLIYINEALAKLSGYDSAQSMLHDWNSQRLSERFDLTDEFGEPLSLENLPSREALKGVKASPMVIGYRFKDTREQRWSVVQSTPIIDDQGQVQLIVTATHDITQLKKTEIALRESETILRQLVENIREVFWIASADISEILYVSPSYEEIFGNSCESVYQNPLSWTDPIHPEDRDRILRQIEQLRLGEPVSEQYRIIKKDGSIRWIFDRSNPVRDEQGEILYHAGIAEDITDRVEVIEALQQANDKLTLWSEFLERQNQEMIWLEQLNDFLQACLTTEEAYKTLGDLLKPLFPGCSGGIFMNHETDNQVTAVVTWGDNFNSESQFSFDQCWALRRGRLHYVNSQQSSLFCSHIQPDLLPVESICVPMMAQGKAMGMIYLSSSEEGNLKDAQSQFAHRVGEQLALALANLKLREELREQSIRDSLTNLFNRRYLDEFLTQEISRAKRKNYPVVVIMIDVDYFGQFNKDYGHDIGDAVLKTLATFLQNNVRTSDIACRFGGEELILILPDISLEDAAERAELLREGIKNLRISPDSPDIKPITASFGLASLPQHGETAEEILKVADSALRQAKQQGRDRVIIADEIPIKEQ